MAKIRRGSAWKLAVAGAAVVAVAAGGGVAMADRAGDTAGADSAATARKAAALLPLYVDPGSNPATWARNNAGDARAAKIKKEIGGRAIARWFGNWNTDIAGAARQYTQAAEKAGAMPVLVAYNVPGRDCGSHSGGGAGSVKAYKAWTDGLAAGIGQRPAIVVVEPDGLAQLDCLPAAERPVRTSLIKYAAETLAAKAPKAQVYLDGGNARWINATETAKRLAAAGVGKVQGFSVNVSNFHTTAASGTFGDDVVRLLKANHKVSGTEYVVDVSRNGNGSNGQWCNPAGRKLGVAPKREKTGIGAKELLWIKVPGDSDGACGTAPSSKAGQFSPTLATNLIEGR